MGNIKELFLISVCNKYIMLQPFNDVGVYPGSNEDYTVFASKL